MKLIESLREKAGAALNWPGYIEVKADDEADDAFDHKRHVNHFATCPQADQHRRPRL